MRFIRNSFLVFQQEHPGSARVTAQSAIALVIVMIAVFVLTMLAAGFAFSMKVETKLAQHADNQAELRWMGRSGVEYARWVLALQATCAMEPYDGLNQTWATGVPSGPCATNGAMMDVQQEVHLGHGYFTWKITDMERKWNINQSIAPPRSGGGPSGEMMLKQALIIMGVDAGQTTPITGAVLDWIDADSTTHLEGTESDYYEGLNPSYSAKNAPIDDVSELLYIKGITWEMYSGAGSEFFASQPRDYRSQINRFPKRGEMPLYTTALTNLVTAISSGLINVNTASAEVLQLAGIDPVCAEQIVGARGGEDDGTGLTGPYRSVDQLRRVPCVTLEMLRVIQPYLTVRSTTFEVEITAHVAGSTRTFYATIVRSNPRDPRVVNFYWKI